MSREVKRSDDAPHDELTALAARMLDTLNDATGDDEVAAVVFLERDGRHGLGMQVESDVDAVVLVLAHLDALLQSMGKRLAVLPLREG